MGMTPQDFRQLAVGLGKFRAINFYLEDEELCGRLFFFNHAGKFYLKDLSGKPMGQFSTF